MPQSVTLCERIGSMRKLSKIHLISHYIIHMTNASSFDSPTSIAAPYFQNQSCDPFTAQSSPCQIGDYPVYTINVTKASDAIAGLNFAKSNNVRLVIKNTGHE